MGILNLAAYKPVPATPGDANQIANGFTAIENVVNAITQSNMGAGNKTTASAMSGGPPASPSDGDIWIALAVDANGTTWTFRYNAGSGSAFKWECIGGPPVISEVGGAETFVSTGAYVDSTTPSSLTVARAGDYLIEANAGLSGTSGGGTSVKMAAKLGAAATADADGTESSVAGPYVAASFSVKRTLAASDVVKLQYKNAASAGAQNRRLMIRPVRVS